MSTSGPAASPHVLVARLFHESHAFSPFRSGPDDFVVSRGTAGLAAARGSDTTLGGIVRGLEAGGARVTLCVSASGPPGGLVDHAFYARIRDEIVAAAAAAPYDAIALELHGAMGTPECRDAEGDLLARLRDAAGSRPVGVGLDLHAHVTPAMLCAADICIACKENPHADAAACGIKVASGLLEMLSGRLHPVRTLAKTRMVLPGAQETGSGPLRELHDLSSRLAAREPAIWDISLYNVYRALDDADMGQAAVVTSNGPSSAAEIIVRELAQGFWDRRDRFADNLLSIDEALARAQRRRGQERFALADMGDRVLAGAPGDSTAILAALLAGERPLRAAVPVTDAETVREAAVAGEGSTGRFRLGGKLTPGFEPLEVEARVTAIRDGRFRMRGPYQGGEASDLGETAVLDIGGRASVLVTSRPGFTHDPEAFEAMGVAVAAHDVVVVKSGYHFTLNFAGIATPLLLRTPGIGYYTPGQFAWRHGRFWPEHDVSVPVTPAMSFGCTGETR